MFGSPRPEYKCTLCNKGEGRHNASTKACPLSSGQFAAFHATNTFMNSGKMTIKSKNLIKQYEEAEKRRKDLADQEAKEKATVRSMTLVELVHAVGQLLIKETGLTVIMEQEHPYSTNLHLSTPGGIIRFGRMSVSQYTNGRYAVAGSRTGCFMSNDSERSIYNALRDKFEALEEAANKPKEIELDESHTEHLTNNDGEGL